MRTVVLILLLIANKARAQTSFFDKVHIEYEKTVYVRQLMKEREPFWYDLVKDQLPVTSLTYFSFTGNPVHSVYKPAKEAVFDSRSFYQGVGDKNIVYTNYSSGTTTSQKPIYEETFLIQDSLLKIRWKITADTRNIAGFECRKAIGIIDDSVTVFAFYTDEILIPGGPESVQGLPGLILGMGIPRLHTTWFATKVEVNNVNMTSVKPEIGGKKVNRRSLLEALNKIFKSWGSYGKNMLWNYVI